MMPTPADIIKRDRELPKANGAPTSTVAPKAWRTPAERASGLGAQGTRVPTGIATLDDNTRGGFLVGRVVAIGGAPGAGKTTLAMHLARRWALEGVLVAVLAADEEADGLIIRWGQQEGLIRDRLEEGDIDEKARLMVAFDALPNLHIVDADEESATVEMVSQRLAALRTPGQASVVIVDSIQTVRVNETSDALTPRARVDNVVAALKRAAKVDGHLVIATCELARGAYRSKSTIDQIDDLAAFKESGGIEYGIAAGLVLRSVRDHEDLVDVTVPKNRLGRKKSFRLKLDFRHASFTEVANDDGEDAASTPEGERRSLKAQVAADVALITRTIALSPGVAGFRGLRTLLQSKGIAIGNDRLQAALHALGAGIENRGTAYRPVWHVALNYAPSNGSNEGGFDAS